MQPIQPDESDWLEHGDEKMEAALYDRHAAAVFAYLRLHRVSWEDAEDVTLEVFTAALERDNLRDLSEQKQLAWLLRVAHNKRVDVHRRATRHPLVSLHMIEEPCEQQHVSDPEYTTLQHEAFDRLREFMGSLPLLQQQVVQLRYGEDLSFTEIGLLLKRNEGAVRKLLSRALASLRSRYRHQQQ